MNLRIVLLFPVLAASLSAQYTGPAILSRGEAPAEMVAPEVDFRPYIEVGAVHDTGLAGVGVNAQGQPLNQAGTGASITWGISGTHSWRHTKVGLEYHGNFTDYTNISHYNYLEQSLLLGITRQIRPHLSVTLRQTAGLFTVPFGPIGLRQTVPFDPTTTYVPVTDYFDNRTIYVTSQANLTYQRTARLSFDLGGDGYMIKRSSHDLYGTDGISARGDVQYRLSRRTTIGAQYMFMHFFFPGLAGATDAHAAQGTYAVRLSRRLEFSGYAGIMRVESKFIQTVPVDPIIAALLGISGAPQIVHNLLYSPNAAGRLSRTFHSGVLYVSGGHSVNPGNGLFLTSRVSSLIGGYSFTGLRRWALAVSSGYEWATAEGTIVGRYQNSNQSAQISRELGRHIHMVLSYSGMQYRSPEYSNYNRSFQDARLAFGYSPGDIPLRVW